MGVKNGIFPQLRDWPPFLSTVLYTPVCNFVSVTGIFNFLFFGIIFGQWNGYISSLYGRTGHTCSLCGQKPVYSKTKYKHHLAKTSVEGTSRSTLSLSYTSGELYEYFCILFHIFHKDCCNNVYCTAIKQKLSARSAAGGICWGNGQKRVHHTTFWPKRLHLKTKYRRYLTSNKVG